MSVQADFCKKLLMTVLVVAISIFLNPINVYGQPIEPELTENSFRIILTLFDVNQNTGDVIIFVSSENVTKWKIFTPFNELRSGNTTEVSFTINGSYVNSGDIFKSCVLMIKDISIICSEGENSIAERPEIVDINLSSAQAIKVNVQDESVINTTQPEETQTTSEDEQTGTEIVEVKPSL